VAGDVSLKIFGTQLSGALRVALRDSVVVSHSRRSGAMVCGQFLDDVRESLHCGELGKLPHEAVAWSEEQRQACCDKLTVEIRWQALVDANKQATRRVVNALFRPFSVACESAGGASSCVVKSYQLLCPRSAWMPKYVAAIQQASLLLEGSERPTIPSRLRRSFTLGLPYLPAQRS
jgi:hypothetical protein